MMKYLLLLLLLLLLVSCKHKVIKEPLFVLTNIPEHPEIAWINVDSICGPNTFNFTIVKERWINYYSGSIRYWQDLERTYETYFCDTLPINYKK